MLKSSEITFKPLPEESDACSNNCKNYRLLCEVGSGTYGRVFKALCLQTNSNVALKKIDISKQDLEGFPITAIREIKLLKMLDHPNIIRLREIVVSKPSANNKQRGSTFLVFDYMDHDFVGLKNIKIDFTLPQIKCIIFQILQGVKYLHEKKILHRDLKSANILFNNKGEVKIADFGLARQISMHPQMLYTNKVVTLWYRAPEILLGSQEYGPAVDIWSVGCILVELITGEVLFPGDKEPKQIELIYEKCGTPDLFGWPEVEKFKYFNEFKPKVYKERKIKQLIRKKKDLDDVTLDLIDKLLILNPRYRITAEEALQHDCFQRAPLPCSLEEMPKIDRECHEGMFKKKLTQPQPPTNPANKLPLLQPPPRMRAFQDLPPLNTSKSQGYDASSFFPMGKRDFQQQQPKNLGFQSKKGRKPDLEEEKDQTFVFSEKDHELHFQSDHSHHQSPSKAPPVEPENQGGTQTEVGEKKDPLEFLKSGNGLKSLISSNKGKSPVVVKKEIISPVSEKRDLNELDKLFLPKHQESALITQTQNSKKRVKRERKKDFKEDLLDMIEKKVKTEEKSL